MAYVIAGEVVKGGGGNFRWQIIYRPCGIYAMHVISKKFLVTEKLSKIAPER